MKTNFYSQHNDNNRPAQRRLVSYNPQRLSMGQAILWFVLTALALCLLDTAKAQTPVVNVNTSLFSATASTTYHSTGAAGSTFSSNTYQYNFGAAAQLSNNAKKLNSFSIGTETYSYLQNATSSVKLRRVNNQAVTGTRSLLWVEKSNTSNSTTVAVANDYNDNMESVFNSNTLNQGTDNLFTNRGDGNGNNNNIERLDVVFLGGVISTINTKVGFALFERGGDNEHDAFVIAAITAVDTDGNPTAYASPLRVASAKYGNLPSSATKYYVVRKDPATEANLGMSASGTQNIGGVFISFEDLGITVGQKIYGYSIMGNDLPASATAANLLDYNNSTFFPRNTTATQGGIDLIALTGVLSIPDAVILPPTADNIINDALPNTSPLTAIDPLSAQAANGSIISYTIQTIPAANEGVLYLCEDGNCVPVTAGQVLTPAQIDLLSFLPNPSFTGNAIFYYFATDSNDLISNVASYTIPVKAPALAVLPVVLLNFNGSINGKLVQLNWQTSQELNSSYFEIQRSANGSNFETIATNTAQGNSTSTNSYQITDDLFFYIGKNVFYRIKMVDIDGKFNYSSVLTIQLDAAGTKLSVKAWPVPYANQLNVEYNSEADQQITLQLTNIHGATVLSTTNKVKKGSNIITIHQAQSNPAGTYLLSISYGNGKETIKVVKQ